MVKESPILIRRPDGSKIEITAVIDKVYGVRDLRELRLDGVITQSEHQPKIEYDEDTCIEVIQKFLGLGLVMNKITLLKVEGSRTLHYIDKDGFLFYLEETLKNELAGAYFKQDLLIRYIEVKLIVVKDGESLKNLEIFLAK